MKFALYAALTLLLCNGRMYCNNLHSVQNFHFESKLTEAKDTFSMDQLMNCAIKFIKVIRITEEGWFAVKICNGTSGHSETESVRYESLERFCLNAIIDGYHKEPYMLSEEVVQVTKELYRINLGINRDERLLRAQGMLYALMFNNAALKKCLLDSYQSSKNELNFIILDDLPSIK
jgi:hypothetical protein